MKDIELENTGGHDALGRKIADGYVRVHGEIMDDEIGIEVYRKFASIGDSRSAEAYLTIEQARRLRRHLKRVIRKAEGK
jgi:hypothetical protein